MRLRKLRNLQDSWGLSSMFNGQLETAGERRRWYSCLHVVQGSLGVQLVSHGPCWDGLLKDAASFESPMLLYVPLHACSWTEPQQTLLFNPLTWIDWFLVCS